MPSGGSLPEGDEASTKSEGAEMHAEEEDMHTQTTSSNAGPLSLYAQAEKIKRYAETAGQGYDEDFDRSEGEDEFQDPEAHERLFQKMMAITQTSRRSSHELETPEDRPRTPLPIKGKGVTRPSCDCPSPTSARSEGGVRTRDEVQKTEGWGSSNSDNTPPGKMPRRTSPMETDCENITSPQVPAPQRCHTKIRKMQWKGDRTLSTWSVQP